MDQSANPLGRVGVGFQLVAWLAALMLGFVSLNFNLEVTPEGTQCPIAAVQAIAVPTRICCGAASVTTRKPKPGDKDFVQCRCAEKRSAQHQAAIHQNGERLVLMCSSAAPISIPMFVEPSTVHYERDCSPPAGCRPPLSPPPLA